MFGWLDFKRKPALICSVALRFLLTAILSMHGEFVSGE